MPKEKAIVVRKGSQELKVMPALSNGHRVVYQVLDKAFGHRGYVKNGVFTHEGARPFLIPLLVIEFLNKLDIRRMRIELVEEIEVKDGTRRSFCYGHADAHQLRRLFRQGNRKKVKWLGELYVKYRDSDFDFKE